MRITFIYVHYRVTCYVEQMSAWYDAKTKAEVMNIKVFEKLEVMFCYAWLHVGLAGYSFHLIFQELAFLFAKCSTHSLLLL